jgi:hypothetical protein
MIRVGAVNLPLGGPGSVADADGFPLGTNDLGGMHVVSR